MSTPDLARLLEERRASLEALPGVIGTAVGAGGDGPAIHVYVARGSQAGRVRQEAARLLDGAPVECIEMDVPEAQGD